MKSESKYEVFTLEPSEEAILNNLSDDEKKFSTLAKSLKHAEESHKSKFKEMVEFYYTHKLDETRARVIMAAAGFIPVRISEFKLIADDPQAREQYKKGLGFKPSLEIARTNKRAKKGKQSHKSQKLKMALYDAVDVYLTGNPTCKTFSMERANFVVHLVRKDQEEVFKSKFKHMGKPMIAETRFFDEATGAAAAKN